MLHFDKLTAGLSCVRPSFSRSLFHCAPVLLALAAAGCGAIDVHSEIDEENTAAARSAVTSSVTFGISSLAEDEHCFMSATMAATYGVGNQVRISATNSSVNHLALCTVQNPANHPGPSDRVFLNSTHANRRLGLTSGTLSGSMTNENGAAAVRVAKSKSFPAGAIESETISQDIWEYLQYQAGAQVVYAAPHGQIEWATDREVDQIVKTNHPARNAAWVVRYDTTASGPVAPVDFNHFHITSADISGVSFPDLDMLIDEQIPYAVSFHGFSGTSHDLDDDGYAVLVGGAEDEAFRQGIAEIIEEALDPISGLSWKKAWWDLDALSANDDDLAGSYSLNFINRLPPSGRGVQLEQLKELRDHLSGRQALVTAVRSVYDCILDGADAQTTMSGSTASLQSGGTGYTGNKCPRWIADIDAQVSSSNLTFSVRSVACTPGTTSHVDIYRMRADGTWERVGGGKQTQDNSSGSCVVTKDASYREPTAASSPGTFRVVVRATSGGAPASAQVDVSL